MACKRFYRPPEGVSKPLPCLRPMRGQPYSEERVAIGLGSDLISPGTCKDPPFLPREPRTGTARPTPRTAHQRVGWARMTIGDDRDSKLLPQEPWHLPPATRIHSRPERLRQPGSLRAQSDRMGWRVDLIRKQLVQFPDFFPHRNPSPSAVGAHVRTPSPGCPCFRNHPTRRPVGAEISGNGSTQTVCEALVSGQADQGQKLSVEVGGRGWIPEDLLALVLVLN